MSNCIIDWDNRYGQGIIKSDLLDILREKFSVPNEAYRLKRYIGNPYISQRIYAITPNGRFDIGLFGEIYKHIKSLHDSVNIIITKPFIDKFKSAYNINIDNKLSISLRDYQLEAINKCINHGRGVIVLPTASGKTLVMANLIENLYKNKKFNKCLIITPFIQLVHQTFNDFKEYKVGFSLTTWNKDHKPDYNADVIIASSPILQSKKQDLSILNNIDLLIIDESHKIRKDNTINKLLKKIKTHHIFGFTGTLPENLIDQWNVIGKIGPILYQKESSELREQNYISQVKTTIIEITYKETPEYKQDNLKPTEDYEEELDFLYGNKFRNEIIYKITDKINKNCLILVDRIIHGTTLETFLCNQLPNKKVYFIRGEVEVFDREKIRKEMEENDNVVCIAISHIFSTGINIKNLPYIMFAASGKAKVKIIQSIGRGLRLHENKDILTIFDIADNLKYGNRHLDRRITLYKNEKIPYAIRRITET